MADGPEDRTAQPERQAIPVHAPDLQRRRGSRAVFPGRAGVLAPPRDRDEDREARLAGALGSPQEGGLRGGPVGDRSGRRSGRRGLRDAALIADRGRAQLRRVPRSGDRRLARGGTACHRPAGALRLLPPHREAGRGAAALHLPLLPQGPGRPVPQGDGRRTLAAGPHRAVSRRDPPQDPPAAGRMIPFLVRRALSSVPTLLGISVLTFAILNLLPNDPIQVWSGGGYYSAEAVEHLRSELRLQQDPAARYASWGLALLRGDLGRSMRDGRPVTGIIASSPGSIADRLGRALLILLYAVPSFAAALLLQQWFAVRLGWLPLQGVPDLAATVAGTAAALARHLILPTICLALSGW